MAARSLRQRLLGSEAVPPPAGGSWVRRQSIATIAILSALVVSVVLIVGGPTARAQVGPKTIVVDGDPSDWTGTAGPPFTAVESMGEMIWADGIGDDTGDGDYTYPKAADLNVTGLFDITEARFTADATNLYVLIRLGDLNNPWGGSDGFSTVAGVLLIDTTRDAAGQPTARPNVNISAMMGWEYYVKIGQTGWQAESAKVFDAAGRWAPIVNKGDAALDAIEVAVPLSFIGKDGYMIDGASWRFMLFIQSHDGFQSDGFRNVLGPAWCCDWEFGGGADHDFDPKIMDLIGSATQASQEAELAAYTPSSPVTISSAVDVNFGTIGFVADTTAPAISNILASPTFNQVDISWDTDEIANTTVWYGTSSPPTQRRFVDEFAMAHSVTISGLDSATTYFYQIESWDVAGNRAVSTIRTFTTTLPPPANIASWVGNTFVWEDSRGDDTGDGNYVYPNEPSVRWQGRGDLWFLNMTLEGNWIRYSVHINAKAETIWRQRMAAFAMFIDTDNVPGSGATSVKFVQPETDPGHPINITIAREFAWEWMVLATFQNYSEFTPGDNRGELLLRSSTFNTTLNTYDLVYMSTNPGVSPEPNAGNVSSLNGGTQLEILLNRSVVGMGTNWTYVAVGALYDDAGGGWPNGGIRQVRPTAQTWEGGGANGPMNPNVYDLAFYPTTASQQQDLSEYVSTAYTTITRAMQVDLGSMWHQARSVANVLGMTSTISVTQVNAGESAGLVSFVTDRNAPIAGASVSLAANPTTAVDILTANPTPTNAFGAAMFTVRGRTVATDTTVTLTATANVGGSTVTSVSTLVVKTPVIPHTYGLSLSAANGALGTGEQTTVTAVFTDKGAPISGRTVSLSSGDAALTVLVGTATTNAQGRATFTVVAGFSTSAVDVTLTATATNDTVQSSATLSVRVKAFVHAYAMTGAASATLVAANATTTVTFTFRDAGAVMAGVTVAIAVTGGAFDVVGDVSKATDASGQAAFTLRARSLQSDTAAVVTATASNGTATDVATAAVTVVAQGLPPDVPEAPAAGVATEVFAGVTILLLLVALVFAGMWMRARRPPPRKEEPVETEEAEEEEL